jgi:hypothetical protein
MNKMTDGRPFRDTELARFLDKRIAHLRGKRTQTQIASLAGFTSPPMLAMIKSGASKCPIDRVPALAEALETDPRHLLRLALLQAWGDTAARVIDEIVGTVVSRNEEAWLRELRDVTDNSDPALTARLRALFRALFGR